MFHPGRGPECDLFKTILGKEKFLNGSSQDNRSVHTERGEMLEIGCKVPASFERVWRSQDDEPLYSAVFVSVFIQLRENNRRKQNRVSVGKGRKGGRLPGAEGVDCLNILQLLFAVYRKGQVVTIHGALLPRP